MKTKEIVFLGSIVALLLISGCLGTETIYDKKYSFENNFSGWEKNATDIEHPSAHNGTINWSITRVNWSSSEFSDLVNFSPTDGGDILMYMMDNENDAGKIWMEKTYQVNQNQNYLVNLNFDFGTSDYGINQWTIIAGSPKANDERKLPFQGKSGKEEEESGYVWLNKDYSFKVNSGDDGKIKLMIGVWGTWETQRVYFLDNVNVKIQKTF